MEGREEGKREERGNEEESKKEEEKREERKREERKREEIPAEDEGLLEMSLDGDEGARERDGEREGEQEGEGEGKVEENSHDAVDEYTFGDSDGEYDEYESFLSPIPLTQAHTYIDFAALKKKFR